MKSTILTVAAAALLVIPTLRADDPPADKPAGDKPAGERPGRGPGGRGNFSPEERVKRMTEELGLTAEQADKIKAIYAKNAEAMKALREKGFQNLTDEEKAKARESMQQVQKDIADVLTPEQKKKLEEQRARRGGPGGRRGGPGGPGGGRPTPPAEKPADK